MKATTRIDQLFIIWEWDSYGSEHDMGCYAKAEVSYSTANPRNIGSAGNRRLEWFKSGRLWGIDSPNAEYRQTVEDEELTDQREHLSHFDIVVDDDRWAQLIAQIRRQP